MMNDMIFLGWPGQNFAHNTLRKEWEWLQVSTMFDIARSAMYSYTTIHLNQNIPWKISEIFGTHEKTQTSNLNLLIVWPTKLGGCLRLVPILMGFFIHSHLHHPRDFCWDEGCAALFAQWSWRYSQLPGSLECNFLWLLPFGKLTQQARISLCSEIHLLRVHFALPC